MPAYEAKPESADQRFANIIKQTLDEFSLDEANMVAPDQGAKFKKEARRLWAQHRKDQLVTQRVEKAVRRAQSTGSGGNVEKAIRQNLRGILDNEKLRQGFTPEEIKVLEEIVAGAPVDNFLSLVGKLSPSGNGLMLGLNLGGAAAFGPGALAVGAIGAGAKQVADRGTTQRVRALVALIRSGGKPPRHRVAQLSEMERRALARAVSGQIGQGVGEPVIDQAIGVTANPR